jgi:hypothetical protein
MSEHNWIESNINEAYRDGDALRLAFQQAHLLLGVIENLQSIKTILLRETEARKPTTGATCNGHGF